MSDVIPTHNQEASLSACLRSVANPDTSSLVEVQSVRDGSKGPAPSTAAVLSSYRRFRGSFFRWLALDVHVRTFSDQFAHGFTGRSRWGDRPALR